MHLIGGLRFPGGELAVQDDIVRTVLIIPAQLNAGQAVDFARQVLETAAQGGGDLLRFRAAYLVGILPEYDMFNHGSSFLSGC